MLSKICVRQDEASGVTINILIILELADEDGNKFRGGFRLCYISGLQAKFFPSKPPATYLSSASQEETGDPGSRAELKCLQSWKFSRDGVIS